MGKELSNIFSVAIIQYTIPSLSQLLVVYKEFFTNQKYIKHTNNKNK